MITSRKSYEISDEEWERIKDLLPLDKLKKQGRPPKPNRDMLTAILWIAVARFTGAISLVDRLGNLVKLLFTGRKVCGKILFK